MWTIFWSHPQGSFECGGFCVWVGAGPAQWWKCSVLTPTMPVSSHSARVAAKATSCGQCLMDLSVVPLRAPLKVVGLAVRGCMTRRVVEEFGADAFTAIVWPHGAGGGGSRVCIG